MKKAQKKVQKVMREYKSGTLHSGKGGPVVKSRKQAVAIAMSEAGMKMKKKAKKK
jgi:ribosomal protein L21E